MCARFTLITTDVQLELEFGTAEPPFSEIVRVPRFNITPSQDVPALILRDGRPAAERLRWGLIPFWAEDARIGARHINARAETVHTRPAFRAAFRSRRCLIPADGWYEWKREGEGKVPHWIHRRDRRPFAFAGIWERWRSADGEEVRSVAILTTDAAPSVRAVYERMPVLLPADARAPWLDPQADPDEVRRLLLRPYADGELEAHAVSRIVNSPRNDGPECIEPA